MYCACSHKLGDGSSKIRRSKGDLGVRRVSLLANHNSPASWREPGVLLSHRDKPYRSSSPSKPRHSRNVRNDVYRQSVSISVQGPKMGRDHSRLRTRMPLLLVRPMFCVHLTVFRVTSRQIHGISLAPTACYATGKRDVAPHVKGRHNKRHILVWGSV